MKKLRLYLDTSVIGGCFDKEFEEFSNQLMLEITDSLAIPVISSITVAEIENAPDMIKKQLKKILKLPHTEEIFVTQEINNLGMQYLDQKVIPKKSQADAFHIAAATVNKVDILVSWNFKHIVNVHRIFGFNSVNLKEGYQTLDIRSPREVLKNV